MKRKIIMVNGKKRAGKDFFSDMLVEKSFTKLSIAQILKDIACKIVDIDFNIMEDLKNNETYFKIDKQIFQEKFKEALYKMQQNYDTSIDNTIQNFKISSLDIFIDNDSKSQIVKVDARKYLQNMNIFKIIFDDDDIWIKSLLEKMHQISGNIVISDFRFPNEFLAVRNEFKDDNLISVKVIGKNYYSIDKYDNHLSETSLDNWIFDYHINNTIWHNGSLFWQVNGLLQELDILENKEKYNDVEN